MTTIKKLAAVTAISALAFVVTDAASAQSSLTNGPNGAQPNTLSSDNTTGINGNTPSRRMMRRHAMAHPAMSHGAMRPMARGPHPVSYAYRRPLTVRRTVAEAPVVVVPAPVAPYQGPGSIVTGPLSLGSSIVSLPFRGLNAVFPATGDITTNPLVLIGAPLHAIGDLVQVPFRIVGAPFGGTTIATY